MGESPSMSLIYKDGVSRVRIAWPKRQRYFGRFASKAEAQRWLSEHQQMIHPAVEAEQESAK